MATPDFPAEGAAILSDLQALRRRLHQIPERDLALPQTQRVIVDELQGLPLSVQTGERLDSVVAVLRGARPGPTVLLRSDMDALPVVEKTGLDYASTNGHMHACGHDLHISGLIGAARLLSAHRHDIAGSVVFAFQPGEEARGGAKLMIEEGLLEVTGQTPVAAYGIHVWSHLPAGVFFTREGPLMAGANTLSVVVHGKGGHSSAPYTTIDPVPVACEIVLALQAFITRKTSVFDPVVLTVSRLVGAPVTNAVPNEASFVAGVRTLSQASIDLLARELPPFVTNIAAAHGCTATVRFRPTYPLTHNDPQTTASAIDTLRETFSKDRVVTMPDPVMSSEDFSYVLAAVTGTYVFLGAIGDGLSPETAATNHAPDAVFSDSVLGDHAAALAALAFSRIGVCGTGAGPFEAAQAEERVVDDHD